MNHLRFLPLLAMMVAGCAKSDKPSSEPSGEPSPRPSVKEKVAPKADAGQQPEQKDIVVLTPRAAEKVRDLMRQHPAKYLRVRVSGDYQYKLDLDPQMDPKDDYL